jgi:hypothetical protein
LIQGAAGLLEAVNKAKANLDQLNQLRDSIDQKMAQLLQQHPNVPKSVPTLKQWKTASDQNIRFSSVAARKDQIAALDKLIDDYPNTHTNTIRFVMLSRMQSEIYSHLTNKPNSDRKAAVERLGASVTAVLNTMPANLNLNGLGDGPYRWVMNTLGWRSKEMART